MDSPLVGRFAEADPTRSSSACEGGAHVVGSITILGEPGVGKSRLAAELVPGRRGSRARGELPALRLGITYWPLVAIARDLDLHDVLGAEPDGEVNVHARILEAIGRAEPRSRSDELYWAVRRLLETLARERPVVLLLDDVQWAEPPFSTSSSTSQAGAVTRRSSFAAWPVRDLAELRPAWAAALDEPARGAGARAAAARAPGRAARRGGRRRRGPRDGGNPLFLEEMLRMLIEDDVLVERDGRLPHGGRLVARARHDPGRARRPARPPRAGGARRLQRAAVMGQVFLWGAVAELTPAERVGAVFRHLQALVRKR